MTISIHASFFFLSQVFLKNNNNNICVCVFTRSFVLKNFSMKIAKLATVRETLQSLRVSITVGYSRSPTN